MGTRVMYNRRSKFDPLWNNLVVAGLQDGEPYLGFVDLKGVAFTETVLCTGMGVDLCLPIMRAAMEKKGGLLNQEEARQTLLQCVRLAYLRDCRSWPKYHIAKIDATGSSVETTTKLLPVVVAQRSKFPDWCVWKRSKMTF